MWNISEAKNILTHCRRSGLRLWRVNDQVAVAPGSLCPPGLLATLRMHKKALLDLLEAEEVCLCPDKVPWVHVARQILAGEFDGCDGSTRESLTIGLRNIPHPFCQRALERLGVDRNGHMSEQNQPRKDESKQPPTQGLFGNEIAN